MIFFSGSGQIIILIKGAFEEEYLLDFPLTRKESDVLTARNDLSRKSLLFSVSISP
jgi:hypothetical protein